MNLYFHSQMCVPGTHMETSHFYVHSPMQRSLQGNTSVSLLRQVLKFKYDAFIIFIPQPEIRKTFLCPVWPFLESVGQGKLYLKTLRFGKLFPQF